MQQQGIVITVSLNTKAKKQAGGTYDAWELVYKNLDGEVKTIQKPVQGLRFNPALKASLESLSAGDEFTITLEKNAGGFWDVKSVEKGLVVAAAPVVAPSASKPQAQNNYQGRDYETKAERTKKQEYIIRQSSLSAAVAVLSAGAKTSPKVEEVLELADRFVAYVYNNGSTNAAGASGFDDFEDDIPL